MEKFPLQLLSCTESAGIKLPTLTALTAYCEASLTGMSKGRRESPVEPLPHSREGLWGRGSGSGSEWPLHGSELDGKRAWEQSLSPWHELSPCLHFTLLFPGTDSGWDQGGWVPSCLCLPGRAPWECAACSSSSGREGAELSLL